MENNVPPLENQVNKTKLIYILIFTPFLIGACLLAYFFDYSLVSNFFTINNSLEKREMPTMAYIRTNEKTRQADELFRAYKYQEAHQAFSEILQDKDILSDDNLRQSLELYKTASLLQFDREAALREYYNFSKNEINSNINRAYALLMAQQNVIANNDAKKMLFVLDEFEIKKITSINNKNINYAISKKIYGLYPFPITAARLATYEIDNLDKKSKTVKDEVEKILSIYLYNFDENIAVMLKEEGLKHLVANSYAAKANLYSRLEDIGIKEPKDTTQLYEESLKYAKLFSPRSTYDFMLAAALNHEVKIKNEDNVQKIINLFLEDKNSNYITSNIIKNLSEPERMKENYSYIYARYNADSNFKKQIQEIVQKK